MAKKDNVEKLRKSSGRKKSTSEKIVFGIAFGLFELYAAFILFFFVFRKKSACPNGIVTKKLFYS